MLRTIHDYYTHEFKEEDGIVVAYFETKTDTGYRVYFYPGKDYFDNLSDGFIYKYSYFFGFTKVDPNEDKREAFDARVMNTIINIVNEFYDSDGLDCILIFHCSGEWGADKKLKRAKRFDYWFDHAIGKFTFQKYNEEIVINEFTGENGDIVTDKEYLSIIMENTNPNKEQILDEFQKIKHSFVTDKSQQ